MTQEDRLRLWSNRPPLLRKDNRVLAVLRRYERPVSGRSERVLSSFAELIEASGLEQALNARPFTLLAPLDAALAKIKRPTTVEARKQLVWDHVLEGRLTLGGGSSKERYSFPQNGQVRTVSGRLLRVERGGDGKWLLLRDAPSGVRVLEIDLPTELGVIHVIDHTLF